MAQQVRPLTSLPGDPSSVPDTHVRKAMTAFISVSKRFDTHTTHMYMSLKIKEIFQKSKVYTSESEKHKHQKIHKATSYSHRLPPS